MATLRYLDSDVVGVYVIDDAGRKQRLATLLWGDNVRVVGKSARGFDLDFTTREWNDAERRYEWVRHDAFVSAKTRFRDDAVMKVRFVDVGQGDAAMIESPKGRLVLVDGGEEEHLRHYVSASWAHVFRSKPLAVAAVVVSHGDADHFAGLPALLALTRRNGEPAIEVERVFHNGLVKAPSKDRAGKSRRDDAMFGRRVKRDGVIYATELEDDLLSVGDSRMNRPFIAWRDALAAQRKRNRQLVIRRLAYGDDAAFDFLRDEGIDVQVLGPITEIVNGKPALPFLTTPGSRSPSASHTVNGHSIVLRLTYGNVRMLFGADLNAASEQTLVARCRADGKSLSSEVLKVPHHGSADFSPRILEAVQPVLSVISSGDENATKEYIHPRAGLVGALGKYSRGTVEKPLIYVTEMAAFFRRLGPIEARRYVGGDRQRPSANGEHVQNAYEKTTFGIVHVRTDGERVLVATHSGRADKKEAYVFHVDANGAVDASEEPTIV